MDGAKANSSATVLEVNICPEKGGPVWDTVRLFDQQTYLPNTG